MQVAAALRSSKQANLEAALLAPVSRAMDKSQTLNPEPSRPNSLWQAEVANIETALRSLDMPLEAQRVVVRERFHVRVVRV